MKPCAYCQQPFEETKYWRKFCGKDCLNKYHAKERREAVIEHRERKARGAKP